MNTSGKSDARSEKQFFFDALEKTSPEARSAFLDGACGTDLDLRRRIDRLLGDHFDADTFMGTAAVGRLDPGGERPLTEGPGTRIGRYKLLQKIGEGGFGVVYMAEQKEPVKRIVALKIIKLGMDTKQVIARFEAERQALAMMDHPNIAKVLDGGATETGRPYFVMELVRGVPITHYCDENNLSTRGRLDLFIDVCKAIQHAHQKGIIHRDIKPSNVMITLHDGEPVPKVIDFGIAKATQQELTEKTLFTQYSQLIGTPAYMSPEQAEMSGLDIDTRTDIYSLGVLLYELLVGRTPLDSRELVSGGYDELRRRIKEQEPPKPSTRINTLEESERTTVAKHRSVGLDQLGRELRGDLDWIVLKSLEKDRTRRYETATGFVLDLQRYLHDEPVSAVAPSALYKFRKFARRNRLVFGSAMAITLALVLGLGFSVWSFARERDARADADAKKREAIAAREEADRRSVDAQEARASAERSKAVAEHASEKTNALLSRNLELLNASRVQAYQSDMNLASQAYRSGDIDRVNELVERNRPLPGEPDRRGFEWFHWWQAGHLVDEEWPLTGPSRGFQYSPDRSLDAIGLWPDSVSLGHGPSGRTGIPCGDINLTPFLFTPDGSSLVLARHLSGGIQVHDLASGATVEISSKKNIDHLAISRSGDLLATGGRDGSLAIWETATWTTVGEGADGSGKILGMDFAHDGRSLLVAMMDASVVVWDVTDPGRPTPQRTLTGHGGSVRAIASSPVAKIFATGSLDESVRLWSGDYALIGAYPATGPVTFLRFSPDGTRLAAGTDINNSVLIWEVHSDPPGLELAHHIKGHSRALTGGDFLDQEHFVSISADTYLRSWDLEHCEPHVTMKGIPDTTSAVYSEDGKALLICDRSGNLYRWRIGSTTAAAPIPPPEPEGFRTLLISEGAKVHFGIGEDRSVMAWDTRNGEVVRAASARVAPEDAHFLVLSEDGSTAAWLDADGVNYWNRTRDRHVHLDLPEDERAPLWERRVHLPALSHDGGRLVLSGTDRQKMHSELWDMLEDPPERAWPERVKGGGPERCAAFSRDGKLLATGSWDTRIRLIEAETGRVLRTLQGHSKPVRRLAFSPDGKRLASVGEEHRLCLWDPATGGLLSVMDSYHNEAAKLVWAPDGSSIAAVSEDGTIKVWTSTPSLQIPGAFLRLDGDAPAVASVIVPAGSQWRWLHPVDNSDPAEGEPGFHATFYAPDYDDSAWESGRDSDDPSGGFGYGDEWFEGIEIGEPEDREERFTAYFRHRFTTDRQIAKLELRCRRDDGIIVYLDGVEVARDNMRTGDESYELAADSTVGDDVETAVFRVPIRGELPAGQHVLAVSLHNTKGASSDLRIGGISLLEIE